jgi:glucoside 3-dehydrogenase (cytochrome c) hitch-hiker subunit
MNRRKTLLGLSAIAGHALFPEVLAAFARFATSPSSDGLAEARSAKAEAPLDAQHPDSYPQFLTPAQGAVLAEVVETILPKTATPGAKAASVHVFVDLALKHCARDEQQRSVVAALDALGMKFVALPGPERESTLGAIDKPALDLLRELTLLGYFTSKVGATEALAYEPVPGEYKGCVPLRPGQKAWATR